MIEEEKLQKKILKLKTDYAKGKIPMDQYLLKIGRLGGKLGSTRRWKK